MNLMFQPQFAPLILSGRKIHTIRPKRKIPLRIGQPLSLRVWMGKPARSPQRELYAASVQKVQAITIAVDGIAVDGEALNNYEQNALAWHDGFFNLPELKSWFEHTHGLPFTGELIYWTPHGPQT